MKGFSPVPFSFFIIILQFGRLPVQGFGSTWELYQVFNSKDGKNHSTSSLNNQSTSHEDNEEGSKIPLLFTFKPNQKVANLTTGKGRVLFVEEKPSDAEIIPKFTSTNSENNEEFTTIPPLELNNDLSPEGEIETLSPKSETTWMGISLSSVIDFILQFVTLEDIKEWLNNLKKALISYYGSKYLLGPSTTHNSKFANEISTGRDGWGGIGFPSLEGALLSLAFLTFAVFLIDLIQNLLANFRIPTTGGGLTTGGGGGTDTGTIQIPTRVGKRSVPDFNWMSTLTDSVLSAIEGHL